MTYLTEVLADAPIHFWRLADPGGARAADIGSAGRDLTMADGLTAYPEWRYSGPNLDTQSVFFGTAPFTRQPALVIPVPYSIECFFWSADARGNNTQNNMVFITDAGGGTSVDMDWNPIDRFDFYSRGVTATNSTVSGRYHWRHLVGTDDGTNVRAYVNAASGTPVASAGAGAIGGGLMVLGAGAGGGSVGRCFLSDVAIYGTALSAGRVTAHYTAADNMGTSPIFNGGESSDSSLLALIYAAVNRTFSNS